MERRSIDGRSALDGWPRRSKSNRGVPRLLSSNLDRHIPGDWRPHLLYFTAKRRGLISFGPM